MTVRAWAVDPEYRRLVLRPPAGGVFAVRAAAAGRRHARAQMYAMKGWRLLAPRHAHVQVYAMTLKRWRQLMLKHGPE